MTMNHYSLTDRPAMLVGFTRGEAGIHIRCDAPIRIGNHLSLAANVEHRLSPNELPTGGLAVQLLTRTGKGPREGTVRVRPAQFPPPASWPPARSATDTEPPQ